MIRRTEQWGAMIRYAGSTAGVDRGDLEIIPKTSKKGATTRSLFFYVDKVKQEVREIRPYQPAATAPA